WLERHGPLVRRHARALRASRYVQSHTLDTELNEALRGSRGAGPPFDGITEVWWASRAELEAALASPEGREAARALLADEARFIDFAASSLFLTEEHAIF
ncbi:MAG: EthD domain-containing protein, partial [Myxococcota bacterium]|nr:EthD domain-containing protein [Myxococcota bacterium]